MGAKKIMQNEKNSCDGYDGKSARLFVLAFDAFMQTQPCENSALVKMSKERQYEFRISSRCICL